MELKKNYIKNRSRGFTLIELVVVVTIMLIMTAVVLFNYNNFNESMLLNNFAYDMSLTIRQAQIYGIAVKETPGSTVSGQVGLTSHANFTYAYGVHFSSLTGSNSGFNLFIDTGDANGSNGGMSDNIFQTGESLQTYAFQKGIKIKELCITGGASFAGNCGSTVGTSGLSAGKSVKNLDITFLRPNPEAVISATDANGFTVCDPETLTCGSATIILQNSDDTIKKAIVISSTGQISVQVAH